MGRILARAGLPAPVAGRTWRSGGLAQAKVWINDRRDVVYSGTLTPLAADDDTIYLIVKNQQKFAQSGDIIPTLSPTSELAFGYAAPIYIADNGHVTGFPIAPPALFDIGVAGPLAGFLAAVVALIIGLNLSTIVDRTSNHGLELGEPLLLQFISWVIVGSLPPHTDIVLHPIGFAAWFGLFVTSLNLIPIGQLDGGHVAYALWGSRQRTMAFIMLPILIVLGFVGWPGWWIWAFMAGLWGFGHPPVRDLHVPLGRNRIIVGWIALAVFVLTFAPVPFSFH